MSSNNFATPRVLDRKLGTIVGDPTELGELEDRLAGFVHRIEDADIDEHDELTATRVYVERLAEAGLLELVVPKAYGAKAYSGAGEDVRSTPVCLARQWLARSSGALDSAFVMQGLGSYPVTLGGSDALKAELLPRILSGKAIAAFAVTEPGAGSDVAAMSTRATTRADGTIVLDGEKCFISNAGLASSYVVFAREADDGPGGKPRFGAFWVPGDAAGLSVESIRVIAPHPIGTVRLGGVEVPAEHRLGVAGEGMKLALATLDVFRVTVGAAACGFADRALFEMVGHLQTRVQFGRPLADQQGLRFLVAEVATEHVAAQMLVYRAAALRDAGNATSAAAAMAKLYATESAQKVIDRAVQSLGGLGVTVGQATERLYREIRALRIYEGTSEIQKLVIARALFGR